MLRKKSIVRALALCLVLVTMASLCAFSASAEELINHSGSAVSCARIHLHADREYCEAKTTYVDYDADTQTSTPVYHYSRARMEQDTLWWTTVIKDSGRQWDDDGDGKTYASTLEDGCTAVEYVARTYYSKDE